MLRIGDVQVSMMCVIRHMTRADVIEIHRVFAGLIRFNVENNICCFQLRGHTVIVIGPKCQSGIFSEIRCSKIVA